MEGGVRACTVERRTVGRLPQGGEFFCCVCVCDPAENIDIYNMYVRLEEIENEQTRCTEDGMEGGCFTQEVSFWLEVSYCFGSITCCTIDPFYVSYDIIINLCWFDLIGQTNVD